MVTIALPADIERPLSEEARQRGMTPEDLALEALRARFSPVPGTGTLLDLLGDYIGAVEGSGENVSEDTGKKFAQGLEEKRRQGHL